MRWFDTGRIVVNTNQVRHVTKFDGNAGIVTRIAISSDADTTSSALSKSTMRPNGGGSHVSEGLRYCAEASRSPRIY
jgi:hypothetical protein